MSSELSVLLVCSDKEREQVLLEHLRKDDVFTIFHAANSVQAIEKLKHTSVDVIVSEINIGDVDGWRLARMVRAGVFVSQDNTPFVLITSTYCQRIAETTARAYGIDKVLPFEQHKELSVHLADACSSKLVASGKLPVLVIEDTEDTADLIGRMLKLNYEIEVADTGKKGVELYLQKSYAIVLLDVMLPEMSGQQVLDVIMKHNPAQAVVVMTAHGGIEIAEEMILKGAVDFIQKPFRAEQLRKVVDVAAQREDFMISNAQFEEKVVALQQSEFRFKTLSHAHQRVLDHLSTVVMELTHDGKVKFVNRAWWELTGFTTEETHNQLFSNYILVDKNGGPGNISELLRQVLDGRKNYNKSEFQIKDSWGISHWVEGQFNQLRADGKITGLTLTLDNIDERKQAEKQLNHLALHDTLTDLYNRYYFDRKLTKLTEDAMNEGHVHSLLYIDLDHFKVINDTQGHQQGDGILKMVASKIYDFKRSSDILCRIGGDEFALLLTHTPKNEAETIASELCQVMQQDHYTFDDRIFRISCSIGIAEINGQANEAQNYLQQADIALYVAKRRGRNLAHTYTDEDRDSKDFKVSVQWVHTLQEAIVNDQIVLHFQPIVCTRSRNVAYYEALVRLQMDDRVIFPGEFIPALERAEDINLLDHQVISKAIYMISQHDVLNKVAINLSAQAFSDEKLLPLIKSKLVEYDVAPQRIIFELTESASLSNLSATQDMIMSLNKLGCEFSIDDFGTGFSTFSYLKQLPADSIKIDGSFVKDMATQAIDYALVKAISEVAKALNKKSVAEFVEDEATFDLLKELGVDYAQGYFFSKPVDIQTVKNRLLAATM